jgi:hypothetical protein
MELYVYIWLATVFGLAFLALAIAMYQTRNKN